MTMTTAQIKERDAMESACRYGNFTIARTDGLWSGYCALRRQGKVTLTAIGGGRWNVRLAGALLKAYLDGEDMTTYQRTG